MSKAVADITRIPAKSRPDIPIADAPAVSVVMAFLNEAKHITEAVESVFRQRFTDWELLLVDDGSVDDSTAIARDFAARFPGRVRYLEHENHANRGIAASHHLGACEARGHFLTMLDADDVYLVDNLERQVKVLSAHPEVGMVMGRTMHWYSWTTEGPTSGRPDYLGKLGPVSPNTVVRPPELIPLFLRERTETPGTCSAMIRREVFAAVGGFDQAPRNLFEDQVLFFKICLSVPVYVEGACSALYRQHEDSTCHVAIRNGEYHPSRSNSAHAIFLNWFKDYLKQQGVENPKIEDALQHALQPYTHPRRPNPLKGLQYQMNRVAGFLRSMKRRTLPIGRLQHVEGVRFNVRPAVGWTRFGSLRRVTPISRDFGYDRGTPIDRPIIEAFLEKNRDAVRGRVLEIGDNSYTLRFGAGRVSQSDVLHVTPGAPGATIIGDLSRSEDIPVEAFDCVVLTQTLHLIYDFRAALNNVHRSLKPGGVLLATVPGISFVSFEEWKDRWNWGFTPLSTQRLFDETFGAGASVIEARGNVLVAVAFLHGLAAEELTADEMQLDDPHYPVLITIRATRSAAVNEANL